jgi:hypothetical protein
LKVAGGCHCGLVRFEAEVGEEPLEVLDCNCSICSMTGYLHLIVPDTRFRLLEGQGETTTYRFGTGRARHIFCAQCGIKSFYRPRSHPDGISISLRCVDGWERLAVRIVSFEGRDWGKGEDVPGR